MIRPSQDSPRGGGVVVKEITRIDGFSWNRKTELVASKILQPENQEGVGE